MSNTSLSPVSVVQYNRDFVIEFVRYITGWTERSEVSDKAQLQYLCSYLEIDHINCQTIVVESEYIDRHYLEDYAEYYARCFPEHPRTCSRLHFFSTEFSQTDLNECLRSEKESKVEEIRASYIGFAVIRPIPHTVFAKVCLTPYAALLRNPACKILTRKNETSLFGLELSVDTIPFIEQDKVVSACATSALWVALSTNSDMSPNELPSPSAITKSATTGGLEAARTFPTSGLSPPQILRSLRHYGLEPSIVWDSQRQLENLYAQIHGYLSNNSAAILGGLIYQQDAEATQLLGAHLVCVTGYALDSAGVSKRASTTQQRLRSVEISKLYVHDDRSGPYVRLSTKPEEIDHDGKKQIGLRMSVAGRSDCIFVPTIAIVGLYHKIRIPYDIVQSSCSALFKYLYGTWTDLANAKGKGTKEQLEQDQKLSESLRTLLDGVWDISLTTSTTVKRDLIASSDFITFNGLENKVAVLVRNMPKYVWRCRIVGEGDPLGQRRLTEVLFDATEVPQGSIVVGTISYSYEAHEVWSYVQACIVDRVWQAYETDDPEAEAAIRCFIRFFSESGNSSYLNAHYGPLGLPRRSLKPGETDLAKNILRRGDVFTIRRGENQRDWNFLDRTKKYIWVINELGDIVIGEDVAGSDGFKGHPTLIDGKPGRIAGELFFCDADEIWEVNLRSRAYSGHVEVNERARYLSHVIDFNLSGLPVRPATGDSADE